MFELLDGFNWKITGKVILLEVERKEMTIWVTNIALVMTEASLGISSRCLARMQACTCSQGILDATPADHHVENCMNCNPSNHAPDSSTTQVSWYEIKLFKSAAIYCSSSRTQPEKSRLRKKITRTLLHLVYSHQNMLKLAHASYFSSHASWHILCFRRTNFQGCQV